MKKHWVICGFIFAWVVLLMVAVTARADGIAISFGPTLNGNTNPKTAGLAYEYTFGEASLLGGCRGIFSEKLNGACSLVLSARVETASGLFMRLGAGPAWYFREDDRVSSNFNFNLLGCVGLTQSGVVLGACYAHYSNAGLWGPNLGRDFLEALIQIPLPTSEPPAPTHIR